jgi:D-xylose 1-dehydrogenase (NADP+, D-xylono-1,5-lactone-forming)
MAERLRWGVLGAARVARRRVIPAIQASANGAVVALASRDLDKGRAVADELGIGRVHGSYEALLADPGVDAIYNPLPNALHAEWTVRAAAAGKAVLCEKPLAQDADAAAHVVEACVRCGVPLMEAFMYRFHPQNVRVRALLAQGAIGRVDLVRAGFCFRMDPLDPANVRLQRALAGGALLDVGCYAVNASRMVFGEEPRYATAWREYDERFGVDVALAGVLEYPGRRFATVDCSFKAGYSGWYMVLGSDGTIEVPRAFTPQLDDTVVVIADAQGHRRAEHFAGVDQYRLMAESFAAAVLAGEPVPYAPDDAVCNMRAIDALARAAARNCGEDITPIS